MAAIEDIITLILSIALVVLITLQQRGTGMGSTIFGGGAGGGMPFFQRRGIEKLIYFITWCIAVGLLAISMLRVWLQ